MGKEDIYTIRSNKKDLIAKLHKMKSDTGIAISRITENALEEYFEKIEKEKKG